uniref:Uncharacterized protein n=1 Tax=Avena sativa TaxID=4498 RepID=A0ACD6AD11_AVESA
MVWTDGWKFDASRASHQQSFPEFMEFVRSSLGTGGIVMQHARRLPPQQENPHFQDLELVDQGTTVTLRLRTDNLYLLGFRNTAGQWFRFRGSGPIPGVDSDEQEQLPVSEGYTGSNSLGSVDGLNLSTEAVGNAIRGLAGYGGGHHKELTKWLRTLIVSFIESCRLTGIADTVAAAMGGTERVLNNTHLVNQINSWSSISTALIQAANDVVQDPNTNIFRQFNIEPSSCNIPNAFAAAVALGLVITSSKLRTGGRRLLQYAAADDDECDDVALGLTLLEVLSVVIIDIDSEDPGDLYGDVLVRDSFGSVNLFHRDRSDVQEVRPGDRAELEWPHRAISAADDLVIDLNLIDRDRDPSRDDEVSRGEVLWNSREGVSSSCGVELSTLVTGKNGSAKVLYAVLTNAVVAIVEVLLIDGDGESVPDVYGTITAATKMGGPAGASLDYDLFRQTRRDQVSVPVNTNIPLRRKVITAVLGSPLTVAADLWDKDSFPDPFGDDQIALGSVNFQPRFQDSVAKQITGSNGKVEVRVTWSVSHFDR